MMYLISDTCVLIDMEDAGFNSHIFSLPFKLAVPDILFYEELSVHHSHLPTLGLELKSLASDLVSEAIVLREMYARVSTNNLFGLVLARSENCPLITGDRALRDLCNSLNVKVHGSIWLVEQLLINKLVDVTQARLGFESLKTRQRRLPWDEVEKMLNRYEVGLSER